MVKRKEKEILCKLDVEKASDKLNWKFLLMVLREMGFCNKWIGWIRWCISTISFSVIINGSLASFSKAQGDYVKGTLYPLTFLFWEWKSYPF